MVNLQLLEQVRSCAMALASEKKHYWVKPEHLLRVLIERESVEQYLLQHCKELCRPLRPSLAFAWSFLLPFCGWWFSFAFGPLHPNRVVDLVSTTKRFPEQALRYEC